MKCEVDEKFLKWYIFEKNTFPFEWKQIDEPYLYTVL